jgi:hypothetical protein
MNEKEIIKHLDLLFEKITDFKTFSINNLIVRELKPDNKNKDEVENFHNTVSEIRIFGMNNDLFEKYNDNGWFSLTEKGKEMKLSNLGFIKFSKKTKPKKFDLYKIAPIILTVVFGISTFYFAFANYRLKLQESKVPSLELKVVSLKKELNHINNKLIECRKKPLTKTLDTKKESE